MLHNSRLSLAYFLAITLFISSLLLCPGPARSQDKTLIQVGVVLSLTGDVAAYGERSRKGIMLALDEINSSDGVNGRPVDLILEDAKSSPKDGVGAIQKLIQVNHVPVIVGDVLSSTTLAMAPIAERNKVVLFAPGASNPSLSKAGDYVFRNWASDDFDGKAMAAYMRKRSGISTIAVLAQRTDYTLGLAEAFEKEFTSLGGRILTKEFFDTASVDLRSQLTKVRNTRAKTLFFSGESRQTGTALRQAVELGLRLRWFTNLTVDTPECTAIAGEAREGVIFSTPAFDISSSKPEVQQFVRGFRKKYNEDPEATAGHAYDAMKIVAHVMKTSGTSAEAIQKGLYALRSFPGVTGLTTFDENGDVIKDVFIKTITAGSPKLLEEFHFGE